MEKATDMPRFRHIGSVEILRARTYRIDPMNKDPLMATEAIVKPGVYPLLGDGLTYVWLMKGNINGNSIRRGDGLFLHTDEGDNPLEGFEVEFPSPIFGPDEWKELLADSTTKEGHHEQRLRITIAPKA
jgi:hypothetical protein